MFDRDPVAAVVAGAERAEFTFIDAEPGWTMFMISHFHYDPVWWNTQAAYTSEWTEDPPGRARQTNGFELVAAHLEMARRDPDYKFVLAEVDYLKPYFDAHPEDRADLLAAKIATRPMVGLKMAKMSVNQSIDAQGLWTALQSAFNLHQFGHANNRVIHGGLVDPAGLEVVRNDARASATRKA